MINIKRTFNSKRLMKSLMGMTTSEIIALAPIFGKILSEKSFSTDY